MHVILHITDSSDFFSGDEAPESHAGSSRSGPGQKRGKGTPGPKCQGNNEEGADASENVKGVSDLQKSKKLKQTTLK